MLPSRVVVYLLLAECLFAELGYRQVWHKLTVGLGTLPVANPSDNASWQARARLGAAPLRWLTCIGWALQVIPAERPGRSMQRKNNASAGSASSGYC